jgi:phosphoglycerate kinase
MKKLTVKDIHLRDKKVLVRCDFNVPLDKAHEITDDTRIRESIPTISYILERGAKKVILMSHLGRPEGKIIEDLRLNPVARRLEKLLGEPVRKLNDCVGEEIKIQIANSQERIILLENLRFHPEEENNDEEFSKELASLADIYVNDAFGTAHRAHASTEGITKFLPAVSGLLMEKEIEYLGSLLESPQRPFVAILGGAKVSDKIGVIQNLLSKLDRILIGGGMAYTFLKALGKNIGNSKLEREKLDMAKEIFKRAEDCNVKIFLPVDNVVADKIEETSKTEICGENIPEGLIGVDIGPKTREIFKEELKEAKTVFWNGPLGVFEIDKFCEGTKEIAEFIAGLKAKTVIGGGDTVSAIKKFKLEDKISHISTGGGASLEFLEGKILPGISALKDKI